jgi:hypothetical protein
MAIAITIRAPTWDRTVMDYCSVDRTASRPAAGPSWLTQAARAIGGLIASGTRYGVRLAAFFAGPLRCQTAIAANTQPNLLRQPRSHLGIVRGDQGIITGQPIALAVFNRRELGSVFK